MKQRLQQCVAVATFLIIVSLMVLGIGPGAIAIEGEGCVSVKMYLLQGSGQSNESSGEMRALREELSKRVDGIVYENLSYPFEYPAVLINPLDRQANSDTAIIAMESILTEGGWGVYSSSVDIGASSLSEELVELHDHCPTTDIILAGYSQGADVVGRALNAIPQGMLERVQYVALFGDPKANMSPNGGINPFDVPWKRGTSPLWSDGLLGPRTPYVSNLLKHRTGSWCDYLDGICKGNLLTLGTGAHGRYGEKYADDAAAEIAATIKSVRPELVLRDVSCGAIQQDIVLAINFSPTMRSDRVFMSREGIDKTVDDAFDAGCDVRVGLVEFGRPGKEPTRPVVDFTSDPQQLKAAIAAYANTDTPVTAIETADVLGGVGVAMDYTWRDSAQKAIYVISDAAGDWYGTTNYWNAEYRYAQLPQIASLVERSRGLGGVEVYAIKMDHDYTFNYRDSEAVDFYGQIRALVDRTAGHFGELGVCNFCTWMHRQSNFQTRHADKPATIVAPVRVKVGETVELTAQDVYGAVDSHNQNQTWSYRWYTNCDDPLAGRLDPATVTFRPSRPGTCTGAVEVKQMLGYCPRCYDGAGSRQAIATFPIEILPADYLPPPLPAVPRNITKEYLWGDEILRVSWEPPENAAQVGELAYVIKDADGNIVGVTTAITLHITDVAPDDIPIVTVSVASANGVGESVSTDTADDLTGPAPELPAHDDGAVLSASDVQQLQQMPVGIPTITANTSVSGGLLASMARPSLTYAATNATATALAELHGEVARVAARSSWLSMTIIAVPLALLAGLGVAVKYGVLLKLK